MGLRLRNTKQERFAREVAALVPLATAYREAGYGGDPRWHAYNASKLSNKPNVKARIDELRAEFEKLSAIHVDYIRHLLLRMLEADPRDLYERDPSDSTGKRFRLRSIAELPKYLTGAIAKLKIDPATGLPVEVVLAAKNETAATLLRSLPGGSVDRHEITEAKQIICKVVTNVPDPEVNCRQDDNRASLAIESSQPAQVPSP
jgi:hypothetical protein